MQDTNRRGSARATELPLLFTPIRLRSVTSRNRIVASPMCQYKSEDGAPNDWQLAHLGRLAIGGCGIIFGEETGVEARGRKTYTCAGIWDDKHIPAYRRLTDFIRANGAVPAIQLGHAGRKGSCHDAIKDWAPLRPEDTDDGLEPWVAIAPSALPQTPNHPVPRAMSETDIADVIQAFADAAVRSDKAGYDILEIHGAHGYLIHQFVSPLTNKRNDGYGGSLENRIRFPLEITRAVRAAWPQDKPLFYRLSAIDGPGGMWNIEDSIVLAAALKDCGVDIVDCSAGGIVGSASKAALPRLPGFNVPFAERIKKEAGVPTMAVGLITEGEQAERILQQGKADLIAIARELMWYADWPAHMAQRMGVDDHRFMPEGYAHRLQLRDHQATMEINQRTPENYAILSELAGMTVLPDES